MRRTAILLAAGGFILASAMPARAQESATAEILVLDVPWVWRNWNEYRDIIKYVEQIKQMDQKDLKAMRDEALAMGKEADERYNSGEIPEKDYRIQKTAIGSRLRKLQNYWEIREEIIEKRLREDERRRLKDMQEAVDDMGMNGYPFILKGRVTAYYDPSLDVSAQISKTLNELDVSESAAAEISEATEGTGGEGEGMLEIPEEEGTEPLPGLEELETPDEALFAPVEGTTVAPPEGTTIAPTEGTTVAPEEATSANPEETGPAAAGNPGSATAAGSVGSATNE